MSRRINISDPMLAERVVRMHERQAAELDRCLASLKEELPAEDFEAYRVVVANLMARAYFDVMQPLYEQYPDLEPAALRKV